MYLGFVVPPDAEIKEVGNFKRTGWKTRRDDEKKRELAIAPSYFFSLIGLNVKAMSSHSCLGFFVFCCLGVCLFSIFVYFAISEFKCAILKSENGTYILFL